MPGKRVASEDYVKNAIRNLTIKLAGARMSSGGVAGPHDLLSSVHSDVVASEPVRGDIICANSTPAWTRLPIGAAGEYVRSDGADVEWSELLSADINWGVVTGLAYLTAGVLSQKTLGIANTNIPPIDMAGVADNDYAKFTASGLEGRSYSEVADDIESSVDHGSIAGLADVGDHNWSATKTTAAWSKTIGATGNYATWAAMIADMPDLIAHAVTVTIETGTHLTEECLLDNKSGLTSAAAIQIKAAKYYPTTYGATIPTADSATATTLRDTSVFTVADYYNDCWVVIVNGTGTDNGPVQITDTDGVNGDIIVASWPGTQPDNTSEYIICGAHIDAESTRWNAFASSGCSVPVTLIGICFSTAQGTGGCISLKGNSFTLSYCVAYGGKYIGLASSASETYVKVCGIIGNNTTNYSLFGGVFASAGYFEAAYSRISDNLRRGVMITYGANANITLNAGDNNGLWGTECKYGGQADCSGAECSGSSGNHSDTGTAGSNSADQASAY